MNRTDRRFEPDLLTTHRKLNEVSVLKARVGELMFANLGMQKQIAGMQRMMKAVLRKVGVVTVATGEIDGHEGEIVEVVKGEDGSWVFGIRANEPVPSPATDAPAPSDSSPEPESTAPPLRLVPEEP